MDFEKLLNIPSSVAFIGVAIWYIKLEKEREKYYRDQIKEKEKENKEDRDIYMATIKEFQDGICNKLDIIKEDVQELKRKVK